MRALSVPRLIGRDRAVELAVNTVLPLAAALAGSAAEESQVEQYTGRSRYRLATGPSATCTGRSPRCGPAPVASRGCSICSSSTARRAAAAAVRCLDGETGRRGTGGGEQGTGGGGRGRVRGDGVPAGNGFAKRINGCKGRQTNPFYPFLFR